MYVAPFVSIFQPLSLIGLMRLASNEAHHPVLPTYVTRLAPTCPPSLRPATHYRPSMRLASNEARHPAAYTIRLQRGTLPGRHLSAHSPPTRRAPYVCMNRSTPDAPVLIYKIPVY